MKKTFFTSIISLLFFMGFVAQTKATSYAPEIEITDYKVKKLTISIEAPTSPETFGGIDYYQTEISKNSDYSGATTSIIDADSTSHTFTNLSSATSYYIRLRVYYNDDYDAHDSVWGSTNQNKPKGLKIKNKETRTARLKWNKPTRGLSDSSYKIKVYKRSNNRLKTEGEVLGKNYWDVSGLAAGTKYYFRVKSKIRYYSGAYGKWSKKKYFRMKSE